MEEIFLKFIKPEVAVLIPVLYFVGMFLKKSKLNDKWIPLILGGIGIVLACVYMSVVDGVSASSLAAGFIQGVLCSAASVYCNQIWKQLKQKDDNKK